jgi:hypothetical protein
VPSLPAITEHPALKALGGATAIQGAISALVVLGWLDLTPEGVAALTFLVALALNVLIAIALFIRTISIAKPVLPDGTKVEVVKPATRGIPNG